MREKKQPIMSANIDSGPTWRRAAENTMRINQPSYHRDTETRLASFPFSTCGDTEVGGQNLTVYVNRSLLCVNSVLHPFPFKVLSVELE